VSASAERRSEPETSSDALDTKAVEAALHDLAEGRVVLLLDDSSPYSRGVLVLSFWVPKTLWRRSSCCRAEGFPSDVPRFRNRGAGFKRSSWTRTGTCLLNQR
jgi:hypothetical protein